MKKLITGFLAGIIALSLFGCDSLDDALENFDIPATAKTFTVENLSIDLTDDFFRLDYIAEDFDFCISSDEIVILGSKVSFSEYDLYGVSVMDYAYAFREALDEPTVSEISQLDGIPVMQYESKNSDGEDSVVYIAMYEASDRFWILSFITDADDFTEHRPTIEQYMRSVRCE